MASVPHKPSARTITTELRRRVAERHWVPGQRIEPEAVLAKEFGVCRATIIKCLKELERDGLLWSRAGKGRFVADVVARKKAGVVAVALSDLRALSHPVIQGQLAGVRTVVESSACHLQIFAPNPAGPPTTDGRWQGLLDPATVDGVLLFNPDLPTAQVIELSRSIPVVWTGQPSMPPAIAGVGIDYLGGAHEAVGHLLSLNHRHIAVLTVRDDRPQGREQRQGAHLAMRDLFQSGTGRLDVWETNANDPADARAVAQRHLDAPQRPTAVLCGSDAMTLGLLKSAQALALRIPLDLSVIGWNDVIHEPDAPAPLTSVHWDYPGLGAAAARNLLAMIETPGQAFGTVTLPTHLVIRYSAAPAPR